MVQGFGGVITRLTPAQADYIHVDVDTVQTDEYRY